MSSADKFNSVLADSIKDIPHLLQFDLVAKKRLDALQLDALLVYLIDTVDASAIPYLAAQFDVLGYKGLRLATTDEQRRDVIKRAIELHRFKGTVWAVREALRNIGYPDIVLTEHVGAGEKGWAVFRLELNSGDNVVSEDMIGEIVKMVNEYKNVRSHFESISYQVVFDDVIVFSDISMENPGVNDMDGLFVGGDFRYNGEESYNGNRNYSSDTDILTIEIIS
ncbi:MAG: phage tail protein I [Chitinophagaceae bacterium]|nr:phage tail protein I [Chitinophagaceae bacterium]